MVQDRFIIRPETEFSVPAHWPKSEITIYTEDRAIVLTGLPTRDDSVTYGTIETAIQCVRCGAIIVLQSSPTIPVGSLKGRCGDCKVQYRVDPAPK